MCCLLFVGIDSVFVTLFQTVPMCQNLYRNSFTYHGLDNEKVLQFDDAIKFLGMLILSQVSRFHLYDFLE